LYGYIIPETINRDLATKGQRQFFSKSVVSITAETVVNANGPVGAPAAPGAGRPIPSPTMSPSITPSISVTPSVTPSISVTPSVTPSISVLPSVTPSVTPSITPSITPSSPVILGGSIDFGSEYNRYAITDLSSTDYSLGYNDFTIEWFQKIDIAYTGAIIPFSIFNDTSDYVSFQITNFSSNIMFQLNVVINNISYPVNFVTSIPYSTLGDWTHIAISRVGTTFNVYVNGDLSNPGNSIGTQDLAPLISKLFIGNNGGSFPEAFTFPGKITNFNFVNGTALYNSNFTPPTAPLSPSANTKLLLLATDNAGLLTDSSGLNIVVNNINGVTWSSDTPF
jgi:hypothetical protein